MALQQWALPHLQELLPLEESQLEQVLEYTGGLPDSEAAQHLENLLGDSPQSLQFIASYLERRAEQSQSSVKGLSNGDSGVKTTSHEGGGSADIRLAAGSSQAPKQHATDVTSPPPAYYATQPGRPSATAGSSSFPPRYHTNPVIEAGQVRARDEVSSGSYHTSSLSHDT